MVTTSAVDWDDARIFLAIARAGALSGAAARLHLGVATVSRRLERLEAALGVRLFTRDQTGCRLTDDGEALLAKAEGMEAAALAFGAEARTALAAAGHVRLATAENLATAILLPSLGPLLARHPDLVLDVVTDTSVVNLDRRDADLAVRMVPPSRGNLVGRRLGTLGYGLYGAGSYLEARPGGASAEALDRDRLIGWSEAQSELAPARCVERLLAGRAPGLTVTSLAAQVSAARAGLGLAVLPHFLALDAGLSRVPVPLDLSQPIWLVLHADLRRSIRVRVVADHVTAVIRSERARLEGEAVCT